MVWSWSDRSVGMLQIVREVGLMGVVVFTIVVGGLAAGRTGWWMLGSSVLEVLPDACLFFMLSWACLSEDLSLWPLMLAVDMSDEFKLRLL